MQEGHNELLWAESMRFFSCKSYRSHKQYKDEGWQPLISMKKNLWVDYVLEYSAAHRGYVLQFYDVAGYSFSNGQNPGRLKMQYSCLN